MQQNEHLVFPVHVGIKDAFHSLHFPDDPGLPLYEGVNRRLRLLCSRLRRMSVNQLSGRLDMPSQAAG